MSDDIVQLLTSPLFRKSLDDHERKDAIIAQQEAIIEKLRGDLRVISLWAISDGEENGAYHAFFMRESSIWKIIEPWLKEAGEL